MDAIFSLKTSLSLDTGYGDLEIMLTQLKDCGVVAWLRKGSALAEHLYTAQICLLTKEESNRMCGYRTSSIVSGTE